MSRLQIQSQDVPSAARGTTRLRNRNPTSGHLMLLLHLLRGAHCYVQKCCWGLSSRQRDLPGAQPRTSQSGSDDESFRGVDSTNHLEGTCKKEPCDSMTPMASKTWSCIVPPPAALQLYYHTLHCLLPGKLPPPDQPPLHFKSHSANVLHKFFAQGIFTVKFPTVMQNTRMSQQWNKRKSQV